ncbi:hypothetical protein [Actinokineospora sp. NBRC 105648]|nr:hypothetical protein [Actinokineospora sp. NBRC 105648]
MLSFDVMIGYLGNLMSAGRGAVLDKREHMHYLHSAAAGAR